MIQVKSSKIDFVLKKSIRFYRCARKRRSADWHDHNRPSFASRLICFAAAYFYGSPFLSSGLWLSAYMILGTPVIEIAGSDEKSKSLSSDVDDHFVCCKRIHIDVLKL
jgi:hypothetical protein